MLRDSQTIVRVIAAPKTSASLHVTELPSRLCSDTSCYTSLVLSLAAGGTILSRGAAAVTRHRFRYEAGDAHHAKVVTQNIVALYSYNMVVCA